MDFRDFTCFLSIIKSDNIEDKLRFAFKAYDRDDNGFLDRVLI